MNSDELMEAHIESCTEYSDARDGINAYIDENGETYYLKDGVKKSQKEIDILEVVFRAIDLYTFTSFKSEEEVACVVEEILSEKGLK